MSNFKIPTNFTICGIEYTVDTIDAIDDEGLGSCSPNQNKISIANTYNRNTIPISKQELAFYHELVHSIFAELEYIDDYQDERKCTLIAMAIRDFINTRS